MEKRQHPGTCHLQPWGHDRRDRGQRNTLLWSTSRKNGWKTAHKPHQQLSREYFPLFCDKRRGLGDSQEAEYACQAGHTFPGEGRPQALEEQQSRRQTQPCLQLGGLQALVPPSPTLPEPSLHHQTLKEQATQVENLLFLCRGLQPPSACLWMQASNQSINPKALGRTEQASSLLAALCISQLASWHSAAQSQPDPFCSFPQPRSLQVSSKLPEVPSSPFPDCFCSHFY